MSDDMVVPLLPGCDCLREVLGRSRRRVGRLKTVVPTTSLGRQSAQIRAATGQEHRGTKRCQRIQVTDLLRRHTKSVGQQQCYDGKALPHERHYRLHQCGSNECYEPRTREHAERYAEAVIMTRCTPIGWQVYDVCADITAQVSAAPPELSLAVEAEVETFWEAAQARTGGVLFNGRVFTADVISPKCLSGHMTEYRRIVAQIASPALHAALNLRPLAVCGIVRCTDGVVLGRRSMQAGYAPGIWQLPPAGNVDAGAVDADGRIDLKQQMFRELEEELGVRSDDVINMQALCLIEHPDSHILDFGFLIDLRLNAAGLLAAHAAASDRREYDPLTVIPTERLVERLIALEDQLMPTAWLFVDRLDTVSGT